MTKIKHTTKTNDITTFVSAQIIAGKTFLGLVSLSQLPNDIQSQTIGKHVFSLIQSHVSPHFAAWTEFHHNHQKPNNTPKNHPNIYDNILFFIEFGIKNKIPISSIIQNV